MKTILEWFKPGAGVKRYIVMQVVSIIVLIFCILTLNGVYDLNEKMLVAYIILITLSAFGIIFSFVLAQRNMLLLSLKNISKKNKSVRVKKLLFADPKLKKGPKVVVIGGGSGLPNLLKGLKEYTSNITAVVNVSEDDTTITSAITNNDYLTPGDIRKCIAALSTSESEIGKLLTYKADEYNINEQSVGNSIMSALIDIAGSFPKGVEMIPEVFNMQGKIYPVSTDNIVLCAGLENGEVVVGKQNIIDRLKETKCQIKQVFLKDGNVKAHVDVIEAIKTANVIVLGPGAFYTSVVSNLLIDSVSKAIVKSRAKKIFIANIMNQPGQTYGYTLARYVNEIERYLGKHVIDYAIANNGEITPEMIKDFNQEDSLPVKIDLENITNRAICVVREDLVLTAKDSIIHDSERLAEIIMKIIKSKRVGDLNIVNIKKKHMRNQKFMIMREKIKATVGNAMKNMKKNKSSKNKMKHIKKELKVQAKTQATIDRIKNTVEKG